MTLGVVVMVTQQAEQLQHKQLTILEVRLNKLKIRDAEAESYNERLKLQIDNLRKSRMVINASHVKVSPLNPPLQTRQASLAVDSLP